MKTYIALFRGINVSGQKLIKMADLKKHFEDLGFADVRTYIQSGNVIFRAAEKDSVALAQAIMEKIRAEYGFDVEVLIREPHEIAGILQKNPFADRDTERTYLTLLNAEPSPDNIAKLGDYDYSPEEYVLDGTTIYFYSPNGYGRAKMNNNFFENKLKLKATTRNWKTMQTLFGMGRG